MKMGLIVNPTLPDASEIVEHLLDICKEDFEVVMDQDTSSLVGKPGVRVEDFNVDFVLVGGGDGTFLRALQRTDAPVLTINLGIVGFLSESTIDTVKKDLNRIREGDYFIDERMKLNIETGNAHIPNAVNEGVIHTAHVAKIRSFRINVDGMLVTDMRADGVIVATPTGSTCYALSVGSPILDPRLEAFVIAPIAPYKMTSRPKVVPASSEIEVQILNDDECVLVVDGQFEMPIRNSSIRFSKSSVPAKFIRFEKDAYRDIRERLPV